MARILLSEDHLEARLVLEAGERLTATQASELLAQQGVCYGLRPAALKALVGSVGPLVVLVARGEPAIEGRPGSLEVMFHDDEADWQQLVASAGEFDVWRLGGVRPVVRGTVLAYRTPPSPPKAGRTVLDRLTQPSFPADVLLQAGEGTRLRDDGTAVVAARPGTPYHEDGRFVVRQALYRDQDVTAGMGELEVQGDLTINGHVLAGGRVKAGGNVVVEGQVLGGEIVAEGSIRVRGAVRDGARLVATRHVLVRELEGAVVRAKGHVVVQGDATGSELEAYGEVAIGGAVVGTRVQAGARGVFVTVGSEQLAAAQVVVVTPVEQPQRAALEQEQAKIRETLKHLAPRVRAVELALKQPDQHPAPSAEQRKVLDLVKLLHHREASLVVRKRALGIPLTLKRARLDVLERAHAGTSLQVGNARIRLERPYPAGTFIEVNGQLGFKAQD